MASVWLSRFSRWLEALHNAKGGPVLLDISPELHAVALIMEGNEDRYLQAWNRFAFSFGLTSGAAQQGAAMLHNPPGSGVIAVVERIGMMTIAGANPTRVDVGYQSGPAAIADLANVLTAANIARLDGRQITGPSCIASTTTNGLPLNPRIMSFPAGNVTQGSNTAIFTPNQELVLLPASAVQLTDSTVNETDIFEIMWRERALQSSELT